MKIDEITSKTSLTDKQIEKSISHLLFYKDGEFSGELISLKKVSKSGGQSLTILSNIPLLHLLEITAMGEGSFVNNATESYGLVEIGAQGALVLENEEYLVLSMTNLGSTKKYEIYGVESPILSPIAICTEKLNITAGTDSKKMDVGAASTLILPNDVVALEMSFVNGNTTKMLNKELRAIQSAANDIVVIEESGSVVYGSKNLFAVDLTGATAFEVYADADGLNFYTQTLKS